MRLRANIVVFFSFFRAHRLEGVLPEKRAGKRALPPSHPTPPPGSRVFFTVATDTACRSHEEPLDLVGGAVQVFEDARIKMHLDPARSELRRLLLAKLLESKAVVEPPERCSHRYILHGSTGTESSGIFRCTATRVGPALTCFFNENIFR